MQILMILVSALHWQIVYQAEWLIDSGALVYMCYHRKFFKNLTPTPRKIVSAYSCHDLNVVCWGQINLLVKHNGTTNKSISNDVLYISHAATNLISVDALAREGFSAHFSRDKYLILNQHELQALSGTLLNNCIYKLDANKPDVSHHATLQWVLIYGTKK